jgi:hypothetical protein
MQSAARRYEFLEPWWSTDGLDAHFHETFLNQLKTEVGPEHVMFGLPVQMIGRHGGSDDTLFEILDGTGRFALVHLTWDKSEERPPWPGTEIFPNFNAFAEDVMIPQHGDYLGQ